MPPIRRPRAVAASQPKAVPVLALRIGAVQKVAAKLADILKCVALPADDVAQNWLAENLRATSDPPATASRLA